MASGEELRMDDGEAFYDAELAPRLTELARLCNERGLPFIAQVEYAPGDFGMTADLPARSKRSLPMDWGYIALRCRGNADTLIGHLVAGARERGHSSIYLNGLSVPIKPAPLRSPHHDR